MDGRAMGFLGRPAASTPNLDRLAERGTAFTETYCTSPQCVPSRASFMSGRYAHEIEAWNNSKGLEHDDTTILDDAKAAGYRTAEIGRQDYRSGSHSRFARMTAWVRAADLELPEKDPPVTDLVEEGVRQRTRDWNAVDESPESYYSRRAAQELHDISADVDVLTAVVLAAALGWAAEAFVDELVECW